VTKMKLTKTAAIVAGFALSSAAIADVGVFAKSGKGMDDHTFIEQDGAKAENGYGHGATRYCLVRWNPQG